jgi:DNA recombination protein RmuC
MNEVSWLLVGLAIGVVMALAAGLWALAERRRATRAEAAAQTLAAQRADAEARLAVLQDQAGSQVEILRAQAAHSAQAVAEALVARASETFQAQERTAQAKLEAQLKPVAETLAKVQAQVAAAEQSRAEQAGGFKQQIEQMLSASAATQAEARKLSAALRRGAGVQGRWGEQTLRNVLEAAGLTHRFDFEEQVKTESDEGRRRPDVTVRLPGGAVFVIDAKCSLNAFLEAQEAPDDAGREAALVRHAASVRGHIAGLSAKAYWDQFRTERSPDFVAMFVPGDSFLSAALDHAPDLMTEGMDRRVLLVTPTTLFALCKAVAYGWRVEDQAKDAARIAALGRELYKRVAVMGTHAARVGQALEAAVKRYNEFGASLESQVLVQARRFEDLSADHEGREIAVMPAIEAGVRPLAKLLSDTAPPEVARQ